MYNNKEVYIVYMYVYMRRNMYGCVCIFYSKMLYSPLNEKLSFTYDYFHIIIIELWSINFRIDLYMYIIMNYIRINHNYFKTRFPNTPKNVFLQTDLIRQRVKTSDKRYFKENVICMSLHSSSYST